jgi:hypothetical protein
MGGKYGECRRRAGILFIVAALAVAGPLASSCARGKKEDASRGTAPNAGGTSRDAGLRPGAIPASQQAKPAAPQSAAPASTPAPAARPILSASLRAFGIAASTPLLPSDFGIGLLHDYRDADPERASVLARARLFMDGIAAGRIDPELLAPASRIALAILLAPLAAPAEAQQPAQGLPTESAGKARTLYRLGAFKIEGGMASLRLPGRAGSPRSEGLLTLGRTGEEWYVEGLSLEAPPSASGPVAFDPGVIEQIR